MTLKPKGVRWGFAMSPWEWLSATQFLAVLSFLSFTHWAHGTFTSMGEELIFLLLENNYVTIGPLVLIEMLFCF